MTKIVGVDHWLEQEMNTQGFARDVIERLTASGFRLRNVKTDFSGGAELQIADRAYGNKQVSVFFPFDRMKRILNGDSDTRYG